MSVNNISTDIILLLKDDVSKLKRANKLEKSTILISSTSQLTTLLTSLDSIDDNLTTDQLNVLVSCLLYYLVYEETSSIALGVILELSQPKLAGLFEVKEILKDQLEDLIGTADTRIEIQSLIIIIRKLFPIQIELCSFFFLQNEDFSKIITSEITQLLNLKDYEIELNNRIDNLLKLFSTSCIEEMCRTVIVDQYIPILIKLLKLDPSNYTNLRIKCLVSTILVKSWNNIKKEVFEKHKEILSLDNLTEILINGIIGFNKFENYHISSDSIEGLAFLSLNVRLKKKLRKDDNFIRALINETLLDDKKMTYGILCIVTNLTTFNKNLSKEQESVQSLKDHANLSNINTQTGERTKSEKDDDKEIVKFIINLLDNYQFLSKIINRIKKSSPSKGILSQTIRILSNFSNQPELRSKVIQQGGLNFILTYLANISKEGISYTLEFGIKVESNLNIDFQTRYLAIKTLARILINNDPNLLFKKIDIVTPVPFLLEIIVQYDIEVNGTKYITETPLSGLSDNGIEPIDCFEALIALINISSIDNESIRKLIIFLGWKALDNLMLSQNIQLQRYVLELVSNLIFSPLCSEKLFNWEHFKDENYKNFKKLVQFMNLNDLQSQVAVLNIFANCSEYELISNKLIESDIFINNLIELLINQNDNKEIMSRVCFILNSLLKLENIGLLGDKIKIIKDSLVKIVDGDIDEENKSLAINSIMILEKK